MASPAPPRPGRGYFVEVRIFLLLTVVMLGGGLVYGVWSDWEPAGTALVLLSGGFALITGGYLAFQMRLERSLSAQGDEAPAKHDEPYLPHSSVHPLELGVGMTLSFLGLVLGRAILVLGLVITVHSLIGWLVQSRRRG